MKKINRSSPDPPYIQLSDILREQIINGVYLPGAQLPSETNLCERYKISPMTVRRAIQLLVDQLVLVTFKGRGTYVRRLDIQGGIFNLKDFFSVFNNAKNTKVRVLDAQIEPANAIIAEKLGLSEETPTILIKRLIICDGEPFVYHVENLIYDPIRRIVESELEVTSLYGLFEGKETNEFKWGKLKMGAYLLQESEADLLQTTGTKPAIRLEHIFYDFDDNPVSCGYFICRGDRLEFTTVVGHHF